MFNTIFLYVFSFGLAFANVYCFIKKKYLYLFIPCMLFLPGFYGLELSDKLPLFTVSRMMYLVFYVYALINRKRELRILDIDFKSISKAYLLLFGYFVLRIISNLYYVTTYRQSIKTILVLVFEQLFLLIAFYLLALNKEEILMMLKSIVWTASALFVVGILESIFDYRLFDSLYTVTRELYNLYYYRLGLLRATTTMYAPSLYGNMCVLIIPIIIYLYRQEEKKRYLIIAGMDILAIIHSGARSDIMYLFIIAVGYMAILLHNKKQLMQFVRNCVVIMAVLLVYMSIVSVFNANLRYFYVGTAKSVLNEVGFEFDLNEGAPENTKGFGGNAYGSVSRIRQLSGIYKVMHSNPIFGLGSGAVLRSEIQYYWHVNKETDKWITAHSSDVGLVELVGNLHASNLYGNL